MNLARPTQACSENGRWFKEPRANAGRVNGLRRHAAPNTRSVFNSQQNNKARNSKLNSEGASECSNSIRTVLACGALLKTVPWFNRAVMNGYASSEAREKIVKDSRRDWDRPAQTSKNGAIRPSVSVPRPYRVCKRVLWRGPIYARAMPAGLSPRRLHQDTSISSHNRTIARVILQ